jgi:hypothetical protein
MRTVLDPKAARADQLDVRFVSQGCRFQSARAAAVQMQSRDAP